MLTKKNFADGSSPALEKTLMITDLVWTGWCLRRTSPSPRPSTPPATAPQRQTRLQTPASRLVILRGKAVVAAFRVVLIQLIGRRGQELQCYRNLTFVPVSPILKVFLFSDGPSQPPSIPKYVSATNVLRDGYRGHIVVHLHCILY